MGMQDDGIRSTRRPRISSLLSLMGVEDSWAESSHKSPCIDGWTVNDSYVGKIALFQHVFAAVAFTHSGAAYQHAFTGYGLDGLVRVSLAF